MKRSCFDLVYLIYTAFLTLLLCPYASSAETCEPPAAKVVSVQGTVESQRMGETQWQPAKLKGVSHLLHEAFLGVRSVLLLAER